MKNLLVNSHDFIRYAHMINELSDFVNLILVDLDDYQSVDSCSDLSFARLFVGLANFKKAFFFFKENYNKLIENE